MSDPDGTEYAGGTGRSPLEAFESLSRALGVPLDVAIRSLAEGSAAAMITEVRGMACPGCGGTLPYASSWCLCGHQKNLHRQKLADGQTEVTHTPAKLMDPWQARRVLERKWAP